MRYTGAVAVAWIIVELAAAIAVAHAISWPLTVLLLVIVSLIGIDLLRREGWAAFRRRRRGESPEHQLGDAAAGILAAGLVAVPGFVTAIMGLLGLTPPGRALARRVLAHRFATQFVTVGGWNRRRPADDPRVVDSTIDNIRRDPPHDGADESSNDVTGPVDLGKHRRTL